MATEYKLKKGKVGEKLVGTYKGIEKKFTDSFLEKDEKSEAGYTLKTGTTADKVTGTYKKMENGVVGGYKIIENGVVGGYKKLEEKFVSTFLEKVEVEENSKQEDQTN